LSCNLRPFFGAERFYPPNKIVSAGLDSLGIAVADLGKPEVAADIDAFQHGRTTDPQPRRYGSSRMGIVNPRREGQSGIGNKVFPILMPWEFPRLCRGGSNSLTIPAVVPHASIEETLNVSRQAHEGSSIDEWVLSLPRLRAQTPSESFSGLKRGSCTWGSGTIMQSTPELAIPSECAIVPRVPPLGGSNHWGRVAPPIAALSGSPPKAPGSAGGYLLRTRWPAEYTSPLDDC
jgi:hypothetical protein